MRRSVLLTISSLGVLITLLGGTGLFAALTDSAFTGDNQVDSAPLAGSADLQLATAATGGDDIVDCGPYADDLTSGLITATDLPEMLQVTSFFCIRNLGSQAVDLTVAAVDLVQLDPTCTGDETDFGDATCGDPSDQGELAPVLNILWETLAGCDVFAADVTGFGTLADHDAAPVIIEGVLGAGQEACLEVGATIWHETPSLLQIAQSDTATWRFRFTGTATP